MEISYVVYYFSYDTVKRHPSIYVAHYNVNFNLTEYTIETKDSFI